MMGPGGWAGAMGMFGQRKFSVNSNTNTNTNTNGNTNTNTNEGARGMGRRDGDAWSAKSAGQPKPLVGHLG